MKKHDICLNSILPKGNVITQFDTDMLQMTATSRLSTSFDREMPVTSYAEIPSTFKLPLRIDFKVKIDSPGLFLLMGKGHLNFGTPWSDNKRIDDIIEPSYKPRFFHNHLPMNEFADITIIYDFNAVQISVNGEERYYSEKEKYMKSKLLKELNNEGFTLRITCSKRTNMVIKSLSITEYDKTAQIVHSDAILPRPLTRNEAADPEQKPTLEKCISLLPEEIKDEIIKTDDFLRSLRPMKFRRQYEKNGNKITYLASDHGFSYAVYPSNDIMHHSLSWYIITNGKAESWHRKADLMEATLNKLSETAPELAEKMFNNLKECIACCPCVVRTPYEFNGKKKLTCHGGMELKMCASDFEDVRAFISTINQLITEMPASTD